jgi:hypothetical protein
VEVVFAFISPAIGTGENHELAPLGQSRHLLHSRNRVAELLDYLATFARSLNAGAMSVAHRGPEQHPENLSKQFVVWRRRLNVILA